MPHFTSDVCLLLSKQGVFSKVIPKRNIYNEAFLFTLGGFLANRLDHHRIMAIHKGLINSMTTME